MSNIACPICKTPWTKKVSQSEKNPNRVYNTCDNCFLEKPGEFFCWDGELPNPIKLEKIRKAKKENPPAKKRKVEEEDVPSPPLLPRSVVELIQDEHCDRILEIEKQYKELREILLEIQDTLKREFGQ